MDQISADNLTQDALADEDEVTRTARRERNQCKEVRRTRAAECARLPQRNLNNDTDPIFRTPIAAMTEATLRLMTMPQNPELERVINLTKNTVEQLKRQNPLSSLHGTRSRATATTIPQASRTPGGHQRQQHQEQQNRRNQEDQEAASSHRPRGGQPQANQAPGPQPNRNNNNRRNNGEEVADSIVDARHIINARCRVQPVDNSDRFSSPEQGFRQHRVPEGFQDYEHPKVRR